MTVYYEEIMELWKAGEFFGGISYLGQWMSKGLLTQEEIRNLSKNLPKFWGLIEVECEKNVKVMFNLYEMLKKARNWDDKTLQKKLRIREKTLEDIKSHRRPRSKAVGLKMLYELFPQMAV
jgi:predicted DNA binding CopG/RHH family protein